MRVRFVCRGVVALVLYVVGTAAAQQQLPGPDATTIKVNVRRVALDIVVTDKGGKPVAGLTRDDFRVFEDGAPQQVRFFEGYKASVQPPLQLPKLPPNTFSNYAGAMQGGPATVILYDLLNTPLDSQPYAHAQLLDFLKNRKNTGQVAIFVLTDRLHMLQGFTDDDNQLIAALNSPRGKGYKSGLLQTGNEATQQTDQLGQTEGNSNAAADTQLQGASGQSFQTISAMLQHMETMETSALLDRRIEVTTEAMVEISSFLAGLPGRKNLLWLSGSFPSGILPQPGLSERDGFMVTRNFSDMMKRVTNSLNASHTAVYPVDVRGLQVNSMFSAANNVNFPPGSGKDLDAVRAFTQQQNAEHASMDTIGDDTGGHAFYNTNGLKEAIASAENDGSTYYTLTYSPSNRAEDGSLRRVKVECLKPGYKLAYRSSYFAADSAAPQKAEDPFGDAGANDPMALALRHGAPPAHELFFEAHVQTDGAPAPATPEEMATLAEYEMKKGKKPSKIEKKPEVLQGYLVTYGLLARQLDLMLGRDGMRRGSLEFAVMAFDDDGNTIDGVHTKIQDVIKPERYADMQAEGYQFLQRVALPTRAASMRIGVRDVTTGKIGSMELRLPLVPEKTLASAK